MSTTTHELIARFDISPWAESPAKWLIFDRLRQEYRVFVTDKFGASVPCWNRQTFGTEAGAKCRWLHGLDSLGVELSDAEAWAEGRVTA